MSHELVKGYGRCNTKLRGLFTFNGTAPVSDSPKIHYFWWIRHTPLDILEESEQHSWRTFKRGQNKQKKREREKLLTESLTDLQALIPLCLFVYTKKNKDTIQFHLTLWMELDLSSKRLLFLSLHIVHQMQCGMIFHHLFWLLLPPLLIQQLSRSAVCLGMVHVVFVRVRNKTS